MSGNPVTELAYMYNDMYPSLAASNTVDLQLYCRETVTTVTVICCLNIRKSKRILFNCKLVENITKCTPAMETAMQ